MLSPTWCTCSACARSSSKTGGPKTKRSPHCCTTPSKIRGKAEAERIRALFGDVVARIVLGCTDSFVDTAGGEKKLPWIVRKRDYLARLREEGDDVAFVSAADKLDNARATERDVAAQGDRLWQIFNAPKARTIAYYRELIAVYATKAARVQPIVRELRAIIERIGADVPADATMESASA